MGITLEFLEVVTVFLSKEYNVSCSCVYPIMVGLITNIFLPLVKMIYKLLDSSKQLCVLHLEDIGHLMIIIDLYKSPALPSFYDPCFKGLKFISDEKAL